MAVPDYQAIIDRFYPAGSPLRDIYLRHCRSVADYALEIAHAKHLPIPDEEIETGAMLHDIGIFLTHAPSIECHGEEPYIRHGILGADLLRSLGVDEKYARIAELHTGSGLTAEEIKTQSLPLPDRDYLPKSLLEKLICYADKYYSKSGTMTRKDAGTVRRSLAAKSVAAAARFDSLASLFS